MVGQKKVVAAFGHLNEVESKLGVVISHEWMDSTCHGNANYKYIYIYSTLFVDLMSLWDHTCAMYLQTASACILYTCEMLH